MKIIVGSSAKQHYPLLTSRTGLLFQFLNISVGNYNATFLFKFSQEGRASTSDCKQRYSAPRPSYGYVEQAAFLS